MSTDAEWLEVDRLAQEVGWLEAWKLAGSLVQQDRSLAQQARVVSLPSSFSLLKEHTLARMAPLASWVMDGPRCADRNYDHGGWQDCGRTATENYQHPRGGVPIPYCAKHMPKEEVQTK